MTASGNGLALVVGISSYMLVEPLPSAVRIDAEDVSRVVGDTVRGKFAPEQVRLLLDEDATADALRAGLVDAAASLEADDPFLLYFSGHGHRSNINGVDHSWLLTYESDLEDLASTSLAASELAALLDAIPSRRQIVLLDACHAGAVSTGKSGATTLPKGLGSDGLDELGRGAGRAVLASCKPDEVSLVLRGERNSVFTSALLDALQGAAQDRGDGLVRVLDVFHHVAAEVPRRADQHPVLRAENLDANFPVARRVASPEATAPAQAPAGLERLLTRLYPLGPMHDEIWSRAGGDVSRLPLSGSGLAQWHIALRRVAAGGDLTLRALLIGVAADHPQNHDVAAMLETA